MFTAVNVTQSLQMPKDKKFLLSSNVSGEVPKDGVAGDDERLQDSTAR